MNIYKKLLEVQSKLKCNKAQYNTFGKYAYRSCEDILEALKPILADVNATIFIKDEIQHVEGRFYVKAIVTFVDVETGENISTEALAREEENKKGMDGSQVTGSCSSYARKYALNGMFAIDDTKDADATNDHGKGKSEGNKTTVTTVSDAQLKRLYAIANKKGYKKEQIADAVKRKFDCSISEMTKTQYDQVVAGYEKLADK